MPELPEVETVRKTLLPAIGARISSVWDSGLGLHMGRKPPRRRLRALEGQVVTDVRRHGKYLLLDTDHDQTLLVHLGMTGRLCIVRRTSPRLPHTHVILNLGLDELRFTDPRRFGQIDVFSRARNQGHPALAGLGPDALTSPLTAAALHAVARRRGTTLKALVLDQRVLAGVGNIYASEALWRAKLAPNRRARTLNPEGAQRLTAAITEVLSRALHHGGTTLSDFVDANGHPGDHADHLWVYGRTGDPCRRCKGTIKRAMIQGRATFFCPRCQRR